MLSHTPVCGKSFFSRVLTTLLVPNLGIVHIFFCDFVPVLVRFGFVFGVWSLFSKHRAVTGFGFCSQSHRSAGPYLHLTIDPDQTAERGPRGCFQHAT